MNKNQARRFLQPTDVQASRIKSHDGKRSHHSLVKAANAALQLRRKGSLGAHVYRCNFCSAYHVGNWAIPWEEARKSVDNPQTHTILSELTP